MNTYHEYNVTTVAKSEAIVKYVKILYISDCTVSSL